MLDFFLGWYNSFKTTRFLHVSPPEIIYSFQTVCNLYVQDNQPNDLFSQVATPDCVPRLWQVAMAAAFLSPPVMQRCLWVQSIVQKKTANEQIKKGKFYHSKKYIIFKWDVELERLCLLSCFYSIFILIFFCGYQHTRYRMSDSGMRLYLELCVYLEASRCVFIPFFVLFCYL